METTDYQVVHAIAGRIRCRLPALRADKRFADQLQHALKSLEFVTEVRLNPAAESIIISYKERAISSPDFEAGFAKLIQQLKSAPPVPPPVPLSAPEERSLKQTELERVEPAPQSTEEPVTAPAPPIAVEPPLVNSGQDKPEKQAPEKQVTVSEQLAPLELSELPSVWDDTTPLDPPEVPKTPEVPKPKTEEVVQTAAPQTTADLAQRLGVTGQALNRRRSLSNFAHWSQIHDPQGLGWAYDPATKLFYPAESESAAEKKLSPPTSAQPDTGEKTGDIKSDKAATNGASGGIAKPEIEQIQNSLPLTDASGPQSASPKSIPDKRSPKPTSTKRQSRSPRRSG